MFTQVSNLKPLVFKILTILSEIWPGVLPVIELLMLVTSPPQPRLLHTRFFCN